MTPFHRDRGFRLGAPPHACVLAVLLALVVGGCGDDDENPMKPNGPAYPDQSTPQNVLAAYEMAYSARDTVKIKELYDSTYTGSSVDLNDIGGGSLDFTFDDEIRHVGALRTQATGAYLELGTSTSWTRTPSDDVSHPEWSVIQIAGSAYLVQILDGDEVLAAQGEAGTFQEFAFSPDLDSTSPTDTLWRIVRWRETGRSDAIP